MRSVPLLLLDAALAWSQVDKSPLVAVMPLTAQGVDPTSALVVTDALSDELTRKGQVRVMERSQMEKILAERGFQQSGICDGSDCALAAGKLLAIDRMVVGSLGKLGDSYTLSVRSVDVATGEVLGSARRMRKGAIDDVIADLLPLVIQDLAFQKVKPAAPLAAAPAGKEPSAPASSSVASGSSSHWGWWLAGGAVVAGGATAALLLGGKSGSTSSSGQNPTVTLDAQWK